MIRRSQPFRARKKDSAVHPDAGDLLSTGPIRVASCVPGADFEADLFPNWMPHDDVSDRNAQWARLAQMLATQHLLNVTEKWTSQRLVHRGAATELAINSELATTYSVGDPIEIIVTGHVNLRPAPGSEAVTDDYLGILRDEQARIERTRSRLELHEFVFENTKRAWLWWIDQHPDKLTSVPYAMFVNLLNELENAQVSTASDPGGSAEDSFASVVADFVSRTDPDHATLATKLLREYLDYFNHADLVQRVEQLASKVARNDSETKDDVVAVEGDHASQSNSQHGVTGSKGGSSGIDGATTDT